MAKHLRGISDWIERAIVAKYKLTRIQEECAGNARQIRRQINKQFGKPTRAWLRDMRLRTVRQLLQEGKSLKSIAYDTGFRSSQSLSHFFTRTTGESPTEFLRRISKTCEANVSDCEAVTLDHRKLFETVVLTPDKYCPTDERA